MLAEQLRLHKARATCTDLGTEAKQEDSLCVLGVIHAGELLLQLSLQKERRAQTMSTGMSPHSKLLVFLQKLSCGVNLPC
jgi:hypothetical protein